MDVLVKPRWQTAVAITVLFFLAQFAFASILGVDIDTMNESADNV